MATIWFVLDPCNRGDIILFRRLGANLSIFIERLQDYKYGSVSNRIFELRVEFWDAIPDGGIRRRNGGCLALLSTRCPLV